MIVGGSNAVNLTDGLDGLAIMPVSSSVVHWGVIAYAVGNAQFASYLHIPYVVGAGELVVFCAALGGAGLGFLWFNTCPAQVFMGDVGALALGAALGTIAVIVRHEIVFFIYGGCVRAGNRLGGHAGGFLQIDRTADFPHGADSSPF